MKKFTIAMLLALSVPAMAAEPIVLWGEGATPPPAQEAPQKKPSDYGQDYEPAKEAKGAVDTLEGVIYQAESLEQQARRVKNLFNR
ncbi:MAG: hypothetical protein ACRC8R_11940 [Aeromonas hydrophila]